jgi:hypothetical protein
MLKFNGIMGSKIGGCADKNSQLRLNLAAMMEAEMRRDALKTE